MIQLQSGSLLTWNKQYRWLKAMWSMIVNPWSSFQFHSVRFCVVYESRNMEEAAVVVSAWIRLQLLSELIRLWGDWELG